MRTRLLSDGGVHLFKSGLAASVFSLISFALIGTPHHVLVCHVIVDCRLRGSERLRGFRRMLLHSLKPSTVFFLKFRGSV